MAAGVLGGVLPLSVRVVGRRIQDHRPRRAGPLVVGVRVLDAHVDRVPGGGGVAPAAGHDHRAVPVDELRAVLRDAKANVDPNTSQSQSVASTTSGYASTGMTVAAGTDRFVVMLASSAHLASPGGPSCCRLGR